MSRPPTDPSDAAALLLQIAVPGILVREGRIACANDAAVALLDRNFASDVVGRDFGDLFADDAPHLIAARMRAGAAGMQAPRPIPALVRRPSGETIAVDLSLTAIEDAAGAAVLALFPRSGWLGERIRLLDLLDGRMRDIVDAVEEYVVVQDLQGRILLANRAVQELLGRAESDVRGRSLLDFMPPGEHAAVLERAASRLTGSTSAYTYETTVLASSGEPLAVRVTSAPIVSEGRPLGVFVVGRPADDRLRNALHLQEERDAAREASRLKSEFLAKMSHEVRTPINVIFGMSEMALDGDLSAETRELVDRMRSAASSLLGLIDAILDLSRIEAGRLELEPRPFRLRPAVRAALEPLEFLARRQRVELDCWIASDVPDELVGDPDRLRQVVVNLVANGIKFTPAGRVALDVTTASTPTPGAAHLLFAVRDTGIGIARDERARVFEPFRHGDGRDELGRRGAGLGLAIARELVGLMGGRIWVESELGRGSTFYFTATFAAGDGATARAT